MNLSEADKKELQVKRATSTPLWKGFITLVKYRTARNYRNPEFLGPRIGDKVIFTLLMGTLYLGIGDDLEPSNYINIAAVLFMWCTMPACVPISDFSIPTCLSCVPASKLRCAHT
jgi:ATP-binding cassette, subfamily G (WHITE), member 2